MKKANMDIVTLIRKQNALEEKKAEMRSHFPLKDKAEGLQYRSLQEEIKSIETEICATIKVLDEDMTNDYSVVTQAFADAVNKAAEKGVPLERVIYGENTILDLRTASCMFRTIVVDGVCTVIGGLLTAQCTQFPWLFINITNDEVGGDPVWHVPLNISRPHLSRGVGCGYHLDGSFQREMLAFFRREYARQQASRPQVAPTQG